MGRKKKADEVYRLGIARRAAPLERLKNRHAAFLTRIMAPSSADIPEDDPTPPPSNRRAVLGAVGGLAPTSTQQTPAGSRSRGPNGSKIEVFSDAAGRSDPDHTPWEDFGTRDGRRKENTIDAVPWKGETLPQSASRHRVAPRTPKIEVFKDAGADNGTAIAAGDVIRAKAPPNEAEMLRFDPLRNFDVGPINPNLPVPPPTVAPAAPTSARKPQPKSREAREKERGERKDKEKRRERSKYVMEPWTCPTDGPEVRDAKGKLERRMFDWDAVFKGGEEYSFEEVRARQRGLLGKQYKPVADWEREWHAGGATSPKAPPKAARPPSPTVNTKLANAEVMSLFNQTIHGHKIQPSDSESSEDEDDGDEDEQADHVQPLPTPLPRPRPVMSMMTPGGMVPPTPTPAPGAGGRAFVPGTPNIFADENAPPTTGKMAVFADENAQDENAGRRRVATETPARKPLGLSARTPLAPTPRAFAVYDENDPSATPAPSAPVQRNIFALQETIAEEDENSPRSRPSPHSTSKEKQEAVAEPEPEVAPEQTEGYSYATEPGQREPYDEEDEGEEEQENRPYDTDYHAERFTEHYEDYNRPLRHLSYNRQLLTPVTERTFEHTVGTAKSSRHTTAFGATEEEDEDEDDGDGAFLADAQSDEKKSWRSKSDSYSSRRSSTRDGTEDPDRSGLVDTGVFSVPEGYTIARKLDQAGEMTIARKLDQTRIDGEEHGEGHGEENTTGTTNNEFVTAQYGDTQRVSPKPFAAPKLQVFQDAPARASPKMEVFADKAEARSSPKLQVFREEPEVLPGAFPAVSKSAVSSPAPAAAPALAGSATTPIPDVLSEIPNPCNPTDDAVVATLLERIDPPLDAQPLIHRIPDKSGRLAGLQKHAKMHARRSSSASMRQSISPDEVYPLNLDGKSFEASHKLGEGGFGAVFLAVDKAVQDALDDGDDEDVDEDSAKLAIKVEKPACLWEAVILSRVHERIPKALAASIIKPRGLYAYADESFLLLDYCKQGTLLDVVNKASQWSIVSSTQGPAVPAEVLVIFFTIELLRLVEGLHSSGFIHGDLKIDNCLVRLEPPSETWQQQYTRTGAGGWSSKGVRLIDFGRSSDLSLFSAGEKQTFVADWKVDQRDCVEMRAGQPWSFEADYFGLASVCYCLLYGKYIGTETVDTPDGPRTKLDAPMKRVSQHRAQRGAGDEHPTMGSADTQYWQTELWTKLFDTLLNPRAVGELPITSQLASIRGEFETWLEENHSKNGVNLRQLLKRIELRATEGRP